MTKQDSNDSAYFNSIFGLEENDLRYCVAFHNRVQKILTYAQSKKCSVMIDAEQSYIQSIIDSSAKFYTYMFNKSLCTVLQTIQCYLKNSQQNCKDFVDFVKKFDLKLGVKLVRGAYMTEESKLAINKNYENPIHSTIEDTHTTYNTLITILLREAINEDKVNRKLIKIIIASHNEDSIKHSSKFINESNKGSVYSAQLIGISEHITILSKHNVKTN